VHFTVLSERFRKAGLAERRGCPSDAIDPPR
jgi:hypothetical protein